MNKSNFEWDEAKNIQNQNKHKITFDLAQYAFADSNRIIAKDIDHSEVEDRYYCFGKVSTEIVTFRKKKIRIIGAGYWRKGKRIYEKENKI